MIAKRAAQMQYRLLQGNGKYCEYQIGLSDDGTPTGISFEEMIESLDNMCKMALRNNAKLTLVQISHGYRGKYCKIACEADLKNIEDDCNIEGFFDIWKYRQKKHILKIEDFRLIMFWLALDITFIILDCKYLKKVYNKPFVFFGFYYRDYI